MNKEDCIIFAKKYNITMEGEFPNFILNVSQIGKILGVKNNRDFLRRVSDKNKCKFVGISGIPYRNYVTFNGLKEIVATSRKSMAQTIALDLNMGVIDSHVHRVTVETRTINFIMECFQGQKMITQYSFDSYRVDLYFPDFKIVVECDEDPTHYSSPIQINHDKNRQLYIERNFHVRFIRYRPFQESFKISSVVNEIFNSINK
jgi:very-short-patch-repair endonuclease